MNRPSGRASVSLRAGVGRRLACHVTWVIAAMTVLGCSSSKSSGGSGGATGSGGRAGTGGATATGGGSGSGGSGATGTGGAGTGGASGGAAGAPNTGGRGGGGGASGGATGGTNGDGGIDHADASGSDAPANDAASDGAVAFAPCPTNGTACVILPLGDSITEGFNSSGGGYRVELFRQTVINAKSVTFVGSLANGPATVQGRAFPMSHEGHIGYTIDIAPIAGRNGISDDPMMITDYALATYHPDIVLLMIGTNDVDLSVDLPNAPTRLGNLLDRITTGAPNALLVVAQITPTTNDVTNARIQTYNAAIPQLVQTRVAGGKHILLVNMYGAFTANAAYKTTLMSDELHPNDAGYALLGQTWYGIISGVLP